MSTSTRTNSPSEHRYSAGAVGLTAFAAVMLIVIGTVQAMQGLVALVNDTFYVTTNEYVFRFDVTTWGWIHLLLGVVVAAAGFGLTRAATWARVVAIIVASISIVANFLWMPYYPFWSLLIIALNVAVIWAVTMHGRDIAAE